MNSCNQKYIALRNQLSKDHFYASFVLERQASTPVLESAPAKENSPLLRLSLVFASIIHAIAKIPIFKVIHTESVMDLQILFHFARSCILRTAGVHFIKLKFSFWHFKHQFWCLKCQEMGV